MTTPTPPPLPARPAPAPGPTRLTARSPEDLLAATAVVLGFWPTESVVMLTFDAAHPFHARVDLPTDPAALPELAQTLVQPAAAHRVGRVVLLVHTADRARGRSAWRALRRAFGDQRIEVVEALLVTADRWFPLLGGVEDAATAAAGVPFDAERLTAHPFLAEAVVEGRVLHRSRAALAASLDPDPAAVARVAALVACLPTRDAAATRASVPVQLAEGTWAQALVARHLHDGTSPTDAEVARLLCGMQSLRVRDAAWSAIDRVRARPAAAFFADVLRRSPSGLLPAAAALLGWAAWQAGDGALAWCALERCEEVSPDYGLCGLLGEALERAVPPSVWTDGFDWKEGLDERGTG